MLSAAMVANCPTSCLANATSEVSGVGVAGRMLDFSSKRMALAVSLFRRTSDSGLARNLGVTTCRSVLL